MFQTIDGGQAAQTVSPMHFASGEQIPRRLREHLHQLKRIVPVISVSVWALRSQNADLDEDIASLLSHAASQPLAAQIECVESLLESLAGRA